MFYYGDNVLHRTSWRIEDPKDGVYTDDPLKERELRINESHDIQGLILKGSKPLNIVSFGSYFFIDEATRKVLSKNGITGWDTYPISFSSKIKHPKFYGMIVDGRVKAFGTSQVQTGVLVGIEPDSWDGSDVFCDPTYGFKFFSQKFFDLIRKEELSGLRFLQMNPSGTIISSDSNWL